MTAQSATGATSKVANSALLPLAFLVGEWRTTCTHPLRPGQTLVGQTSFAWHEGGAFLIMRNEVDDPDFPTGLAIFASDDSSDRIVMNYFDERGVSRLFDVVADEHAVSWRREDPTLAQSVSIIAEGSSRLITHGRMSEKGGPWGDDLSQLFERKE